MHSAKKANRMPTKLCFGFSVTISDGTYKGQTARIYSSSSKSCVLIEDGPLTTLGPDLALVSNDFLKANCSTPPSHKFFRDHANSFKEVIVNEMRLAVCSEFTLSWINTLGTLFDRVAVCIEHDRHPPPTLDQAREIQLNFWDLYVNTFS